jgi:hypothetical protein
MHEFCGKVHLHDIFCLIVSYKSVMQFLIAKRRRILHTSSFQEN